MEKQGKKSRRRNVVDDLDEGENISSYDEDRLCQREVVFARMTMMDATLSKTVALKKVVSFCSWNKHACIF